MPLPPGTQYQTPDVWAAWVLVRRQDLDACLGHIRRVGEELSKPD
jgi:hypothetical protein